MKLGSNVIFYLASNPNLVGLCYLQDLRINRHYPSVFQNPFHSENRITATDTPAIPAPTTGLAADPKIHLQIVAKRIVPIRRAAK
jgi:hypothetical protein